MNQSTIILTTILPARPARLMPLSSSVPERPQIQTPSHFDEKPAMSLKDALSKAMTEHNPLPKENKQEEDIRIKKEISEEILRKLVEDEA